MTIQNIIKKIWKTEASDEMKNNLSWLLSNWDLFIELKQINLGLICKISLNND